MNRMIILVSSFIILLGCCSCKINTFENNETNMDNKSEGKYYGIVSDYNFELGNESDIVSCEFVMTEKLALEIGNAVITSVYGEDVLTDTKFAVYELKDKDVFVVSRIPCDEILGGDYNVALSKTDGRIIKVWSGE